MVRHSVPQPVPPVLLLVFSGQFWAQTQSMCIFKLKILHSFCTQDSTSSVSGRQLFRWPALTIKRHLNINLNGISSGESVLLWPFVQSEYFHKYFYIANYWKCKILSVHYNVMHKLKPYSHAYHCSCKLAVCPICWLFPLCL